jgi:catalase (peroxidase I)
LSSIFLLSDRPENAGLQQSINLLEPLANQFSISHGDLYTLAAVVSVKFLGGK